MDRNFLMEQHHQSFPTLQSIDAQSEFSIDLRQNETESLITKLFLLCLELDRKDLIIDQLQNEAQRGEMRKSQVDISHRDLNLRYEKLQNEYRNLLQANAILKNDSVILSRANKELEIYKSNSLFNQELQEKVMALQNKLKRAEEEKIEYLEREKNLKRQMSMLSYNVIKTSEKNRVRDLEHELAQEKSKLDHERRANAEHKFMIEKYSSQLRTLKQAEIHTIRSYEQKIELIRANVEMRNSQVSMVTEEKIILLTQQLNRLKEEVEYLRNQIKEQKLRVGERDEQIKKLHNELHCYEVDIQNFQNNYLHIQDEGKRREEQLVFQLDNLQKENKMLKINAEEIEYVLKQKSGTDADKIRQIQSVKDELELMENENVNLKSQIRKLKRKSVLMSSKECETCKIRSSLSLIPSGKKIQMMSPVDLDEVIRETEKLIQSNHKVESMISHHEQASQHSIDIRQAYLNITETH